LNIVRNPTSRRGTATALVAAWYTGANMKHRPASTRQRAATWEFGAGSMPSASMTSWDPARDDSARLPCLATRTPAPATMNDAAVVTLTVPDPSPPVPQVSSTGGSASTFNMRARMARAAPTTSSTVSPFIRSAASRAPTWAGVPRHP
jgi:hypothetical protein